MTLGDAADQGVDWRTLKKAPEELLKENPFEFLKEEFKKKKAAERKEH